jgi:3-mercaptopyruvate sulfurtransferase SseA
MNTKWIAEGRPVTKDKPKYPETKYPVPAGREDHTIRAFFEDTLAHSKARKPLIDVRSATNRTATRSFTAESASVRVTLGLY